MVLAVGRLELAVTVGVRDEQRRPQAQQPRGRSALEAAYDRQQRQRAVEADRNRWATISNLSGFRLP